jgi:hypothetical protein
MYGIEKKKKYLRVQDLYNDVNCGSDPFATAALKTSSMRSTRCSSTLTMVHACLCVCMGCTPCDVDDIGGRRAGLERMFRTLKEALRHQQLGFIRQSNLAMQWLVSTHGVPNERNPLPTVSQSFFRRVS